MFFSVKDSSNCGAGTSMQQINQFQRVAKQQQLAIFDKKIEEEINRKEAIIPFRGAFNGENINLLPNTGQPKKGNGAQEYENLQKEHQKLLSMYDELYKITIKNIS